MITGIQIRAARILLGWEPGTLARKAKVPIGVVLCAENSPGEPVVTIVQLNALMATLHAAGATFPPTDPDQP